MAIAQSRKTHCPQGHPYAGENLRHDKRGRACRTCDRDKARAYRAKQPRPAAMSPMARFFTHVDVADCWTWNGHVTGKGYGMFKDAAKGRPAHRWLWEQLVGPLPAGVTLDHLCRNRRCVNPDHLEPVTNRENIRRGYGPAGLNARKVECHLGHPLWGDNLAVTPRGTRRCRECHRARSRRWRSAQKAA